MRTEDEVRNSANNVLGFSDGEADVRQGTGQITTFKQLGFNGDGRTHKPDGWYFPKDIGKVAIVLETKAESIDIHKESCTDEIVTNIGIASQKYGKVVGILYNGTDVRVFKGTSEITEVAPTLQHKTYYSSLFTDERIDKQKIYRITKQINDCLHTEFGIKNLYHRMIFTACALVAKRYGAFLDENMDFPTMKTAILTKLNGLLTEDKKKNEKLTLLTEVYEEIKMNNADSSKGIKEFVKDVSEISECVNSDSWHGEDVMGIFFNEFNRYKKKSESGQVFTPDHITSFMYRLIDVHKDDRVLDAACGSGAFLVKAMCNMIREAGGVSTTEAVQIKARQLYGIEFDREIFALACANMLIHKDGKTNLVQMDARSDEAARWISMQNVTKVLMNPPFERKYGCLKIVQNVLDSVPTGTLCAFILPDKKLEKDMKDAKCGNKLLKKHRLTTIVKLPENLFDAGVVTSVFVFKAGHPQLENKVLGYYVEDDGLERVKNQGRQDIKDRWQEKEDYWVEAIHVGEDTRYGTKQIIDPKEHLSYQKPEKPFELFEEDFVKTMMDYEMFKQGINVNDLGEMLLQKVLYSSQVSVNDEGVTIEIRH